MSVEILVDAVVYSLATYLDKWASFRIRGSILAQAHVGPRRRGTKYFSTPGGPRSFHHVDTAILLF